jgi:hypothetical protein
MAPNWTPDVGEGVGAREPVAVALGVCVACGDTEGAAVSASRRTRW